MRMANIIIRESETVYSQKKLEEYEKTAKIITWGRQNPVKFAEEIFGLKMLDFQAYTFMQCWVTPYCLLLECRGAGKDTFMSVFLMTKMLLVPNYYVYVSSNSYAQSAESFDKLEKIALQRLPSFRSATDVFANEVVKPHNSETGFMSNPKKVTLYNGSELRVLSNNTETIRGKRGSVWFNEGAWKTADEFAVVENYANVDADFSTTTEKVALDAPPQFPLQLIYTSSASDVSFPFFDKYKTFSKNMFLGNSDYFVADIDAYDVLNFSTIDGKKIKSHLKLSQINKAIADDPAAADRELFNKFTTGAGENALVKMETIVRNSTVRKPLMHGDGKQKFIFCYDPARNHDGSILSIFQVINDKKVGYKLQIENVISMVDQHLKAKTPLPMPEQLEIIKKQMILYNGEGAAEWENLIFYIDAGAGGGGISAVADQLMEDWVDSIGQVHRGIIDPIHKQYQTARSKYPHAVPIVRLLDPKAHRTTMFASLGKMARLDLINFTEYDNKDYLLVEKKNGEFEQVGLLGKEKLALVQINLMKNELMYTCEYRTANGGVTYGLTKDKQNSLTDDKVYTCSMAAYALALMRRTELIETPIDENPYANAGDFIAELKF